MRADVDRGPAGDSAVGELTAELAGGFAGAVITGTPGGSGIASDREPFVTRANPATTAATAPTARIHCPVLCRRCRLAIVIVVPGQCC